MKFFGLRSCYIFGGVVSQERETRVRNSLKEKLGNLFDIKEEVKGSWPLDNRPLRLDLLLRPNKKARQLGFDVDAIGIEIKDQSMMYSNFASFNGNKLSINLYDKNWRYEGGGNAFIENINSDFNLDFQVKNKSVLFIETSTKKYFNNKKVINLNNIEISQREIIKDKFITNLNLLNDNFEFNKHFN